MQYFYIFGIAFLVALVPALICVAYGLFATRRIWQKGVTLTSVLSSYGIYSIFLLTSTISMPIGAYVQQKCAHLAHESPCNNVLVFVTSFLESWLFAIMLVVAVIAQLMYLRFIVRYITFRKLN